MIRYILRRLLAAVPTILILIILSFLIMRLAPGNPFSSDRPMRPEVAANIQAKYGLDQPLWLQITDYIWSILTRFDFGPSFVYPDQTVSDIIAQGFPITFTYGVLAFGVSVTLGLALGIVAAIRHNTLIDTLAVGTAVGAHLLPGFIVAPLLVLVFTLWLGWLPGGGWGGLSQPAYLIMPVIALSTVYLASITRIARSSMLEVLTSNHIRTARAKGLPERQVILKHALRPALLPVISYLGPTFVSMVTGSVVIDLYFSTGGIGKFFVDAALNRDYAVMMGITILLGTLTIVFNLIVDLLYAWIDPKIRY
ncbi:oligopeptide ABC transporter permease OppB [Rhizobium sp. SSA_523]|uniref:oligopeptide ABC transporter permease OppB n=1 Tax=Rhizobium sp. SSA_523 TaxID=2952477 RepID=UPI002090C038|nr:oligopeptide ABC transporter permease OppB [Rhizobium sp. SSA_523]MCO5732168.1 oligopeptide ABC transporter permease OppB [Rhizobium sp. SSA_523]WKC21417.1 oligopeptide ABC transporter permease OppB [Rhizobium sp. SSA_523]